MLMVLCVSIHSYSMESLYNQITTSVYGYMHAQPNLDNSLLRSAVNGEYEKVKRLLEAGASPNAKFVLAGGIIQVIHLATLLGHVDIVRLLIEKGAVVDSASGGGMTPLGICVSQDPKDYKPRMVKLLIENGANPREAIDYCSLIKASREKLMVSERDRYFVKQLNSPIREYWHKIRLLWLGKLKESPQDCQLAMLPAELIFMIRDFVCLGNLKREYEEWKLWKRLLPFRH